MVSKKRVRMVARRQLDQRLDQVRNRAQLLETPSGGWISALRTAYGMSQRELAKRMGVSQQAVSHLESREADGSVTLKALEQAAEALQARLVYAVVPAQRIEELIEARALKLAEQMIASVQQTMRLEDQETSVDASERVRELASELKSSPERLWTTAIRD